MFEILRIEIFIDKTDQNFVKDIFPEGGLTIGAATEIIITGQERLKLYQLAFT